MAEVHISTLPDYDPPGNLPDMNPQTRKVWSQQIKGWMDDEINPDPQERKVTGRTPLKQYFDGTVTAFDRSQQPVTVPWNAFPKLVCNTYA